MWRKQSVEIDPDKWAQAKALAAIDRKTIRDWLDKLIEEAIERWKEK